MQLSETNPITVEKWHKANASKLLLWFFALSLLLANIILLQQTRALTQSFSNEQKQATWFLFQLSKELTELVSEARRLDENTLDIEAAELHYELAWSRFDLLINSDEAFSFFSRNNIQQFFVDLFEQFKQLEPLLIEARKGSRQQANQFFHATQELNLDLIDFVNQNFRLTNKVYEAQRGETRRLVIMQYALFTTFVLSTLSLIYFFYRESRFHRQLALSDPLTKLGNRNALFVTLRKNTLSNTAFSLCIMDLNGFKEINDSLGHLTGDKVLRIIADRLKSMEIDNFSVYRMGGDEFALVFEDKSISDEEIKRHINGVFNTPVLEDDSAASLSTSIGIAQYPCDSDNVDFLINIADKRMYSMKFQR